MNAVQNTISGLVTIRACKNEQIFNEEFQNHLDNHTKTTLIYGGLNRWFGFRLDIVLCAYIISVSLSSVLAKSNHIN